MQRNSLLFGDCLELIPKLEDASIDLVIADLPYGQTECDWDTPINIDKFWQVLMPKIKYNAAVLFFASRMFAAEIMISKPKMYRYDWIWEKSNASGFLNAGIQPLRSHEQILVFYKKKPTYNPIMSTGPRKKTKRSAVASDIYRSLVKTTEYDSSLRYPRSVLRFPSDTQKSKLHPTQKPLALCKYLVETYTNKGGTVLDPCTGSGTVPLAAIKSDRSYVAIENHSEFYQVAEKRLIGIEVDPQYVKTCTERLASGN